MEGSSLASFYRKEEAIQQGKKACSQTREKAHIDFHVNFKKMLDSILLELLLVSVFVVADSKKSFKIKIEGKGGEEESELKDCEEKRIWEGGGSKPYCFPQSPR